jgi:trehalose 6-phosphate synthase
LAKHPADLVHDRFRQCCDAPIHHMGGRKVPRLILVSNRVSVPDPEGPRQAGGLAVAVNAALRHREGIWFGWSGRVTDGDAVTPPVIVKRRKRTFVTLDLTTADYQEYYSGFANRVLWPILHYRLDLAEFSAVDLSGYLRVNARFAEALSRFIAPDDIIWVHDYHLLPLAKELRALGHDNPIGFFLHIPFPPPDIVQALPQHAETLGALDHFDLVGVQTSQDAENLGGYFTQMAGLRQRPRGLFEGEGRRVLVRALPVGITTGVIARVARTAIHAPLTDAVRRSLAGKRLVLGVDRLDYSKGITHRIQAFGQFLDTRPAWRGKVTLLQITPKSRTEVPEYAEMGHAVNGLVGQINGRHGEADWTPIRYVNRSYSRAVLAGLYRSAHVGLVTPLRDGMNLVAKEYVAAQDPEDPGVLILSRFAGAAEELDTALLVNPHEPDAMAEAIETALTMPLHERIERHAKMLAHLMENDIDRWVESFLAALAEARQRPGVIDTLRHLFELRA